MGRRITEENAHHWVTNREDGDVHVDRDVLGLRKKLSGDDSA